jgi:alpha-1,3-rhamnosyltransferase
MSEASHSDGSEVFVFVPSYNHANFVEKSVRSIINQSLWPKKLLVIDDGSTDGSPEAIERALKDCPFESELIVRENRGLSATLNQALDLSDGRYFAYLGSDDVWLADFLRERSRSLDETDDAVLAFGHAYLIDEHDRIVDCTKDWANFCEGDTFRNLLEGVIPVTSGVVFRRSALSGLGWNEDSILEDYELYLRLARRGRFVCGRDVLVCWRKHSSNVSNDFRRMLKEWLSAQARVGPEVGLSENELQQAHRRLEFLAATIFLRHGRRREAFALFRENWSEAKSAREVLELAARFAVPGKILKALQDHRQNRQMEKYRGLTPQI